MLFSSLVVLLCFVLSLLSSAASAEARGPRPAAGVHYHSLCDQNDLTSCSLLASSSNSNSTTIAAAAAAKQSKSHCNGFYEDSINSEGWGKIWLHGDDTNQGWYECGYMEGALTGLRIYQHYKSWYDHQFGSAGPTQATVDFILEQYAYSKNLADANKGKGDLFYDRLYGVLQQFEGILKGVNDNAEPGMTMSMTDLLLLEAAGDLYDIIPATNPSKFELKVGHLTKEEFEAKWHEYVSCSGLIKVADDLSDVFVGHTTWTSYTAMLRMYKNYDLAGGKYQSSFSSKPGVVYSKDDFYVMPREDQRLAVIETTNGIMNSELLKLITPKTLLTWQRIPISNSIATGGKEWTDLFARHQSGTYCNQYIVVDMKLFKPGKGPESKDFIWIIEAIPGYAPAADVTNVLIYQGLYWPSYNIPFSKTNYIISGYQNAFETYGNAYSYDNASRAFMLRRDQSAINSLSSFAAVMRENNYKTDPYANGDPGNALSSRKDLKTTSPALNGGIDSKVTSFGLMMSGSANNKNKNDNDKRLASKTVVAATSQDIDNTLKGNGLSLAQSGPTTENSDLPPFSWSASGSTETHLGQPDTFNFGFVTMDFYAH